MAPTSTEPTQDSKETLSKGLGFLFKRPETDAGTRLISMIGNIELAARHGEDPLRPLTELVNTIESAVQQYPNVEQATPPPADILAAFRLTDYICRTNGDVWQTIDVPCQILCKDVHVTCNDKGAEKEWQRLWNQQLDVDALFEEIMYEVETYGQCYPLEGWKGNQPEGIAFLEPTSMWIGRHITVDRGSYGVIFPQSLPIEKLKDMMHPAVYSSFVVDQNVQLTPYYRVPIAADTLSPVYGQKMAFQRYAIPPLTRAARNIMHRQMLDELRRGTMEGYINQLILATVGDKTLSERQERDPGEERRLATTGSVERAHRPVHRPLVAKDGGSRTKDARCSTGCRLLGRGNAGDLP